MMDFESLYAGYVIKDRRSNYFIGPDSLRNRVVLRNMAERFTKQGAFEWVQNNPVDFIIEDAT